MKVSIIVLSYNQLEETTKPCLASIFKNTSAIDFELIVVDNDSIDDTPQYLNEVKLSYENVKVVLNSENKGYAGGNNDGIRISTGEFVVLLNSDTLVTLGWLDALLSPFFRDDSIGLVGPVSNSVGNEQRIDINGLTESNFEKKSYEFTLNNRNTYFETKRLGFFCVAIRKSVIDRVGFLDEKFGIGMFEDDDYCIRVLEYGYKLVVTEGCFIYHKGSKSFLKYFDKNEYMDNFERNRKIFQRKWSKQWVFSDNLSAYINKIKKDIDIYRLQKRDFFLDRIDLRWEAVNENITFMINKETENLHKIKELKEELAMMKSSKFWKIRSTYLKLENLKKKCSKNVQDSLYTFKRNFKSIVFMPYYYYKSFGLARESVKYLLKTQVNGRKNIVFQLDSFDKGGLEEVVYSLVKKINNKKLYNLFIFVNSDNSGYLGEKIVTEGLSLVLLHNNKFLLNKIIKKIQVDLVNLHYSIFGVEIYSKNNIPIVYTVHNNYIWSDSRFIKERAKSYEKFDKFIAVSDQVGKFFSEKFNINKNKIRTIPNGLNLNDLRDIELVEKADLNMENNFVFINVASFNWNKFHILMVWAMKRLIKKHPNFSMLFVGNILDKNCYDFIMKEINHNGLSENIKIIDYVPKKKVLGLMKMSDCFVLPSLIEGWSIALMEAMYCEMPLIVSDVGSARNIIQNEDIGIIIRNPYEDIQQINPYIFSKLYTNSEHLDNIESLCLAMEAIYNNSVAWKKKAKKGKVKIQRDFNVERMSDSYIEEFNKILTK